MKYLSRTFRIILLPFGLVWGLIKLANNYSRDIQNKISFRKINIDSSCIIQNSSMEPPIHLLENVKIFNCRIGKYTYVNRNTNIQNATIGNYCSISFDVLIGLGNHPTDLFSTSTLFYAKRNTFKIDLINKKANYEEYKWITIGNDVWIGARAIILDGVKIGDGAIIAAGAVVVKDVPPYAIVAGVPSKIIKYRFNDQIIKELLDSKWWNEDPTYVLKMMENFKRNI